MPGEDSPRPKLVSVGDDFTPDSVEEPSATRRGARRAARWALPLLAALLFAAGVGLAVQRARLAALEQEVEILSGQLFTTRSALDAYVRRFAEVRESVDGLQAQLLALDELVSADPTAPAPEPAAGAGDLRD